MRRNSAAVRHAYLTDDILSWPADREEAIGAISRFNDSGAINAIIEMLKDPNADVRTHAATALGGYDTEESLLAIQNALESETDNMVIELLLSTLSNFNLK